MNPTLKKQPNPYSQNLKRARRACFAVPSRGQSDGVSLKGTPASSVDVNDLISIGTEEMIKLSRRYDKEQNDSFGATEKNASTERCSIFYALWIR